MKEKSYISIILVQLLFLYFASFVPAAGLWNAPFDITGAAADDRDSVVSLDEALKLVASENPAFRAFIYQRQAALHNLKQAGAWSNPVVEMEIEEFGWNAPGFRESEFTLRLAQEFEFFGQRGARRKLAEEQTAAVDLQVRLMAFDLYIVTKESYYELAHAQQSVLLNQNSLRLSSDIVDNIRYRLEGGAALRSELILAGLEEQQARVALEQSEREVEALETSLTSLWKAKPTGLKVSRDAEVELVKIFGKIENISTNVDSARNILLLNKDMDLLSAERNLTVAETKPVVTLSGGFKRFEIDNSKSFLIGVSLPVPLFNRNQNTRKSMDAQLLAGKYEIEKRKSEVRANIASLIVQLKQLKNKHETLDTLLLPMARDVYQNLKSAYDAGRIPYTQLIEAKRILNELSFEHNDLILEINKYVIELERITGSVLFINKEE